MVHYEGGWPREIDVLDDEQKQRYCKKLEKEEGYTDTILNLCANMESTILQNSAIDIYEEYFDEVDHGEDSLPTLDWSPKEKKEFRDEFERPVLGISIQNGINQGRSLHWKNSLLSGHYKTPSHAIPVLSVIQST